MIYCDIDSFWCGFFSKGQNSESNNLKENVNILFYSDFRAGFDTIFKTRNHMMPVSGHITIVMVHREQQKFVMPPVGFELSI